MEMLEDKLPQVVEFAAGKDPAEAFRQAALKQALNALHYARDDEQEREFFSRQVKLLLSSVMPFEDLAVLLGFWLNLSITFTTWNSFEGVFQINRYANEGEAHSYN